MKTLLFLTADSANLTQDKKINILGIFNQIFASKFPALHPQLTLVIKLGLEPGEQRMNRKLTLYFAGEDANRQQVKMFDEAFDFPERVGGLDPEHVTIIDIRGILFPAEGTYQFLMHMDDRYLASLSLYLSSLPQPQIGE
ncbi:MAG TPA: hypothetical protein VF918_11740 [Anaerolineales bacterium]